MVMLERLLEDDGLEQIAIVIGKTEGAAVDLGMD